VTENELTVLIGFLAAGMSVGMITGWTAQLVRFVRGNR
jgi:hypothetical protein